MLRDKRYQEIFGILLLFVSLIVFLGNISFYPGDYESLIHNRPVENLIGPIGAWISYSLRSAFGLASYLFVILFGITGWSIIKKGNVHDNVGRCCSIFFFMITLSSLVSCVSSALPQESGGYIGFFIHSFFYTVMGSLGAGLMIVILNLIALILVGIISLTAILKHENGKKFLTEGIQSIIDRMLTKEIVKSSPMNNISEELDKRTEKKKLPWITKKKIYVYETETSTGLDKTGTDHVKLLGISPPINDLMSYDDSGITRSENDYLDDENMIIVKKTSPEVISENEIPILEDPTEMKILEEMAIINDIEAELKEEDEKEPLEAVYDEEAREEAIIDLKQNRLISIEDNEEYVDKLETIAVKKDEPENEVKPQEVEAVFNPININREYIIPQKFLALSEQVDSESWQNEIKRNSELLVNTLNDFGIESKVVNVNRGPVITLYELQIANGIRVSKIVGLSDDIAMALAAYRVRIVAPIPGKSAIGIEIPNGLREDVTLGDITSSKEYRTSKGSLTVAIGKDVLGKPVMFDLKRLPHLLIAGATGAGKSVCVNTIITSLIYRYDPNYVRFILIDPKMVELQLYDGMPHLLTPVITDPAGAPTALKWLVYEMERRYRLLSEKSTRDIVSYNEKISDNSKWYEKLPYIVAIIDELADLMMVASKEIEGYITRIAQKARAVGIHLVLATQRPSVDIITGIIKANFPARIAFQVAQKTDSRTIIDQNGADKLLGRGDMLYQSPMSSFPVRLQGAYISENEIINIVEHLESFGEPEYIDIEECIFQADDFDGDEDRDELFTEALKIVEDSRKASASYLQRRLSIGYNRAARIIEMMEDLGYIGPQQGSKPREVLI